MKKAIFLMEGSLSWPSLGPGSGWKLQRWGVGSHRHLPATERRAVVRSWGAFIIIFLNILVY